MPPNFPATDQHPEAVRYLVGAYYVDAIGDEPSIAEIEQVISPGVASSEGAQAKD